MRDLEKEQLQQSIRKNKNKQKLKPFYLWFCSIIVTIIVLLPIYWIILSSITPRELLFQKPLNYFPTNLTWKNYLKVFNELPYFKYLINTIILSFTSTLLSLGFGFMAAYAFARIKFKGSGVILMAILLSSMLPPVSTILPLFDLFRAIGMLNKLVSLIILYTSLLIPFTTWIFVSFLKQIPVTLEEAAWIDGAGFTKTIFAVILPVMKPALATMFIVNFIIAWNEFLYPLVFSIDEEARTLSVGIVEVLSFSHYYVPWENISAMGSMMLIPIIVLVLFFQKQIMQGLMAGSIKE